MDLRLPNVPSKLMVSAPVAVAFKGSIQLSARFLFTLSPRVEGDLCLWGSGNTDKRGHEM